MTTLPKQRQANLSSPFDRAAQYNAKRRAVIRSAAGAFRRKGYHNTAMTDIAKSLGLSKAALYYYVKSKEEILFECHMMVYDAMETAMKSTRGRSESGLAKLASLYRAFAELLTRDGLALLADVDSLKGEYQGTVLKRRGTIERAVTRIVKAGMKDGSLREADVKITVFFLMGALNWLNVWYNPEGRLSGEQISEAFVRQMVEGVRA